MTHTFKFWFHPHYQCPPDLPIPSVRVLWDGWQGFDISYNHVWWDWSHQGTQDIFSLNYFFIFAKHDEIFCSKSCHKLILCKKCVGERGYDHLNFIQLFFWQNFLQIEFFSQYLMFSGLLDLYQKYLIRDGVKKSKWKFKMAFAMKGGGLEGVSFAIKLFWKMIFLKTI